VVIILFVIRFHIILSSVFATLELSVHLEFALNLPFSIFHYPHARYMSCHTIALGLIKLRLLEPVTVAERSKACTIFARSEAGLMGLNPTESMDVWYVYVFILCLCCPVFS
jgi:hypothetical protein